MDRVNKRSKTTTKKNRIKINLENDQPWNGYKSDQEISQAHDILKTFDLYDIYMETITPQVSAIDLMSMSSRWRRRLTAHPNLCKNLTLKTQLVCPIRFNNFEEAERILFKYIEGYYNQRKTHSPNASMAFVHRERE